jgi:hypothetical protein
VTGIWSAGREVLFQCVEGDWYMVGGERSSLSVC